MSPSELTQQSAAARPALRVQQGEASAGAPEELVEQRALVADRRRLEALPLRHRALGREAVHRGAGGVDLVRALLEVALDAVAHVPVAATGITPNSV